MLHYELRYFEGDRVIAIHGFRARGDEMAVALASDVAGRLAMELWCGARRVKSFPARS